MEEFVRKYAGFASAEKLRKELLLEAKTPACLFDIVGADGKSNPSASLPWDKTVSAEAGYTDYPDECPVQRYVTTLTYTNAGLGLKIITTATRYPDYPVVEFESVLCNLSDGNSPRIRNVRALNAGIISGSGFTVHYNRGALCTQNDFEPFTFDLSAGHTFALREDTGRPTNQYLLHFNFENKAENRGVIAVLSWQGNWSLQASEKNGAVIFDAGQLETDFVLQKGESFRLPAAVFLYYENGDRQEGQNLYRRWILEHNLMREQGVRHYRQNLYLCSGFAGAESDLKGLSEAEPFRFEDGFDCALIYDAGWYHIRENSDWWQDTGNWYPSDAYGREGLRQVSEKARAMGWLFSMWFEPERCMRHTKAARDLTDGVIYFDENGRYLPYDKAEDGCCGLVNYGDEKAYEYILRMLDGYFTEFNVGLYRQDYNFDPAGHWKAYDAYQAEKLGIPRTGMTENLYTTGYLKLWGELVRRHPKLVIDACASGGRRYDLATERFGFAHTKSDYWLEPIGQQCQNFGFYSWHHFGGTAFTDRSEYDVRTRLTLSIGIDMSEGSNYASSRAAVEQWKVTQKYLLHDFYQLTPYDTAPDGRLAMQFHDAEKDEGMLAVYLRAGGEMTVYPRGLSDEATYVFADNDKPQSRITAPGSAFMRDGFKISYEAGCQKAAVIWYKKA